MTGKIKDAGISEQPTSRKREKGHKKHQLLSFNDHAVNMHGQNP